MSGRKAIGEVFRQHGREAGRAELLETIELTGGNLRRTAFFFGISREWLYTLIRRENLQPDVDRARASAARPDWLVRARRRLREMDEGMLGRIKDACAGKSVAEIAEEISASGAAGYFQDVPLVAAWLASISSGDGGGESAA